MFHMGDETVTWGAENQEQELVAEDLKRTRMSRTVATKQKKRPGNAAETAIIAMEEEF